MKRKVCVVTGTRADYGLLRWVMAGIQRDADLELQIVVTGMHLSPEFGLTYRDIENDGFKITRKVEMLLSSDTPIGVTKSMGLGLIGFGEVLQQLQPDLLLVLGDRFEIFSAVSAALFFRIPVAHLHGGEITEGAVDDVIRHSITKMSHLHFVAAEEYRDRVLQLGESPDRVFLVGGLGLDNINMLSLLERPALEDSLGIKLADKNLLITFHPVTLEDESSSEQMGELLYVLDKLENVTLIFTMPNADTNSRALFDMINEFVNEHKNAQVYTSLGQLKYLSCIKHMDAVVGNSSSGLIEAPTFGKGTINIGERQRGRLKATSVIDCKPERESILLAIQQLFSIDFQQRLKTVNNPYGVAGASEKIVKKIRGFPLESIFKKSFYNLEC